ncbi:MAG: hypothetical protein SFH39_17980 [Candidatus Magnetobacterium sp. LHC-1]|uniref:Nucleotidyltransferase n=1 Tax=Candidatus Magnetobacterium casense TaxID=1455061 RepID=A0ABS6RW23_9BACT|nr:hypothetical protein [Candidatus Magnetobacterium casensis]MBF0608697.1 hypothetical protein [Nitrospirota bacterium]MBV6340829.1 hypothetical protein [Candidatus Magnetobacterium casensis]
MFSEVDLSHRITERTASATGCPPVAGDCYVDQDGVRRCIQGFYSKKPERRLRYKNVKEQFPDDKYVYDNLAKPFLNVETKVADYRRYNLEFLGKRVEEKIDKLYMLDDTYRKKLRTALEKKVEGVDTFSIMNALHRDGYDLWLTGGAVRSVLLGDQMERLFVISNRVGYLDRTRDSDTFVLNTWSPTEYGDDETTYRDYFDDKLDGYKHALIKIEDMDTTALGLVPQDSNDKHFVEIDYFNFPIECDEKGLNAVMITEGILSGENNNYDDLLKNIVELTKHDGVSLKFAIFQRLLEYFHTNEIPEPGKLYELLPWEFLEKYLEYLILLISKFTDNKYKKTSNITSDDLPDLMFYFSSVSRNISYNLLPLVEEMEKLGGKIS